MSRSRLFLVFIYSLYFLNACGGNGSSSGISAGPPAPPIPRVADHFLITAPASVNPGIAFNFSATALDDSNNKVTGYSGTVHFSSTDAQAVLPADSTLSKGTMMFSATLKTLGAQTITASDTATAITGTFGSIAVSITQFQTTGNMEVARVSHTATLLNDGEVLIAGGTDGNVILSSAELFNPTSGIFTPTGNMSVPRESHTATLLNNGKVLITGGINENPLLTAELFDPNTGTFTATGSMETERQGHTATLLKNGEVLVTGGLGANTLATAELYDPGTETFTSTGSMETARYYHTATLLSDGKVLIVGGGGGGSNNCGLVAAELYDPSSGIFTETGSMETTHGFDAVSLLNGGKVLVTAGFGACGAPFQTVELFDPVSGTFTLTGGTTTARARHTATLRNDGTVLVAGGVNQVDYPLGCTSRCQKLLLATSSAELYDPISGIFVAAADMSTARETQAGTLLNDGTVLITGGRDANGQALATAELYPSNGSPFDY
jgi:hypothetical protein